MRVSPLLLDIMIAQHRLDFWHVLGGIGDLHDQSSLPTDRTRLASGLIIDFPVRLQVRGITGSSWLSAEFQAQHKPARLDAEDS